MNWIVQGYRNKTARHTHTPQPTQPTQPTQPQQQPQQTLSDASTTMLSGVPEQATPPIMPFYGGAVSGQGAAGGQMMEPVSGGFGAPLRDRFGAAWPPPQPTDAATLNGLGSWGPAPPQSQFIQQVPPPHHAHPHPHPHAHPHAPHQLDELRYHHPQYAATPAYHQAPGYQQAFLVDTQQQSQPQSQSPFQQQAQLQPYPNNRPPSSPAQQPLTPRSVGSNYSQAHTPQPSPTPHQVNGVNGNVPQRNGINGPYADASPAQPMEYVNGSYNPSQDGTMAPPPSSTPTSRSSSVHMDTGGGESNGTLSLNGSAGAGSGGGSGAGAGGGNGVSNGAAPHMNGAAKTPVNAYQASPTHPSGTASNSGNAMPGYPLHPAPQTLIHQQSSHNSSGYPGQEMSPGMGETNVSSPQHWNTNATASATASATANATANANHINNQQQNNTGNGAGVSGTTNASANRSVWNESGQEQASPRRAEDSPQHQHQQHSNDTSPVSYGSQQSQSQSPQERSNLNSRIKSMILSKQQMSQQLQQQYNQQMQQYNQQVYNQQHFQGTGNGHPNNGQSPDDQQNMQQEHEQRMQHEHEQRMQQEHEQRMQQEHEQRMQQEHEQQMQQEHEQQDQYMIGHITAHSGHNDQQDSNAGNFLVQGHHLRELMRPEGGGQWALSPRNESRNEWIRSKSKCAADSETLSEKDHFENLPLEENRAGGRSFPKEATKNGENHNISSNDYYGRRLTQGNEKATDSHEESDRIVTSGEDDKEKKTAQENLVIVGNWEGDKEVSKKERQRSTARNDAPKCSCFPPDKVPPEPGSYYTHLGAASSLPNLRGQVEKRSGFKGTAVRIEKVLYTGKEGKTSQGCPLAKWVIRRSGVDEKILVIVKYRKGHQCETAWIVVALVAWEGVPIAEADRCYSLLSHKLSRFGLPTSRRCATNGARTCACQGLDPDTCGASFSFGCAWSMYYNGCKYARTKAVRKFRLSVRSEEEEVEERLQELSGLLSPLYRSLAPEAFSNQTELEEDATTDCRLGLSTGRAPTRPFSGVTACIDFCAHAHRDMHNINNGCTVVVSLTKHRSLTKAEEEQIHVLPLYTIDDSDEFGSHESQLAKAKNGAIETLTKFPCEVRVRSAPLEPCRRHGKKRKDADEAKTSEKDNQSGSMTGIPSGELPSWKRELQPHKHGLPTSNQTKTDQLQSSQVTSTIADSPHSKSPRVAASHHGIPDTHCQSANLWPLVACGQTQHTRPETGCAREGADPDSTWPTRQQWVPTVPHQVMYRQQYAPRHERSATSPLAPTIATQHREPDRTVQPPPATRTATPRAPTNPHGPISHSRLGLDVEEGSQPVGGASESLMLGSTLFVKQDGGYGLPLAKAHPALNTLYDVDFALSGALPGAPPGAFPGVVHHSSVLPVIKYFGEGLAPLYPQYPWRGVSVSPLFDEVVKSMDLMTGPFDALQPAPSGCLPTTNHGSINQRCIIDKPKTNFSENPKSESIGKVVDLDNNEECFKDPEVGGVGIALGHGSVLFECAKHEIHATTALRRPNRLQPTRISLVFYQHRNLNRPRHGAYDWQHKMRMRMHTMQTTDSVAEVAACSSQLRITSPTYSAPPWATLPTLPTHPWMLSGPY